MKNWPGKLPDPKTCKQLRQRAKQLRANQTLAERRLWSHLSRSQRLGCKFRRQHIIHRFIVDFYCPEAALVIEVDGAVHKYTADRDEGRQEYLEGLGLTVLRFTNDDIYQRLQGVLHQIDEVLQSAGCNNP